MKIDINLTGTPASDADFAQLRAALVAAQAATPTARVARAAAGERREPAALPTFADLLAADATAAALAHRFAPDDPGNAS